MPGPKHLTIFAETHRIILTNAVNLPIKLTKPSGVVNWRSIGSGGGQYDCQITAQRVLTTSPPRFNMARLSYVSRDDLPQDKQPIYDRIAKTRASVESRAELPRSFQALLNSPDAADVVAAVGEYLRFKSPLDPVIRETTILAVANELNNEYEWVQHEPIARRIGVRDQVIEAIKSGRAPMGLPPKEGVFAQAAKELAGTGTMTERTFQGDPAPGRLGFEPG